MSSRTNPLIDQEERSRELPLSRDFTKQKTETMFANSCSMQKQYRNNVRANYYVIKIKYRFNQNDINYR